jgi:hypothetical protein
LSEDTKDTVKLNMGLVATMTALVLGLLVASTKDAYDTERGEVTQMAAKIIYLDRVLVRYGTDSAGVREMLRQTVVKAITHMWPEESAGDGQTDPSSTWSEELPAAIQNLSPQTDVQRDAKSEASQIISDLGQMRWLMFEQEETSISMPMLVIVGCWLAVLFFSFGLFAPGNGTAIGALLIAAISVSAAIFLIMELDHPFDGLVKISSQPMRDSLKHFEK